MDGYEEWRAKVEAATDAVGAEAWRRDPQSSVYDAALLREHTEDLTRAREARNAGALIPVLQEALYRHLGELADPRLYAVTPLGTKHVVEAFYAEALACIEYLADPDETGLGLAFTLAGFKRAAHIFGRSALMLSGGRDAGLLPPGRRQGFVRARPFARCAFGRLDGGTHRLRHGRSHRRGDQGALRRSTGHSHRCDQAPTVQARRKRARRV